MIAHDLGNALAVVRLFQLISGRDQGLDDCSPTKLRQALGWWQQGHFHPPPFPQIWSPAAPPASTDDGGGLPGHPVLEVLLPSVACSKV